MLDKKIAIVESGICLLREYAFRDSALDQLGLPKENISVYSNMESEQRGLTEQKEDLIILWDPLLAGLTLENGNSLYSHKATEYLIEKIRSEGVNTETPILCCCRLWRSTLPVRLREAGANDVLFRDDIRPENFWNYVSNKYFDSDGGIVGNNLDYRGKAKRWIHFSNSNKEIIDLVSNLFKEFGLKYFIKSRIHSGFGSKKVQYEVKIYNFKDIFYFYKNINFCIARKQKKLKEVIQSYDSYPKSLFNRAKELHKKMGYRKVAKEIGVPNGVVYGWLFKNNQKQILDLEV